MLWFTLNKNSRVVTDCVMKKDIWIIFEFVISVNFLFRDSCICLILFTLRSCLFLCANEKFKKSRVTFIKYINILLKYLTLL
ncbi:hypothetical protein DN406_19455 [Bacillus sp. BB56-3]|nr:hypothetical protein DN406_19455 [Bacillus sp. BB56-3]